MSQRGVCICGHPLALHANGGRSRCAAYLHRIGPELCRCPRYTPQHPDEEKR